MFRRWNSAFRVDPDAGARPGSGARRHHLLLSKRESPDALQPFGSMRTLAPAVVPVVALIVSSPVEGGAAQPPFGSIEHPSPARTCVLAVIGPRVVSRCRRCGGRCRPVFPCSCSWCPRCVGGCGPRLAVGIDLAAMAGMDRAGDRHRNLPCRADGGARHGLAARDSVGIHLRAFARADRGLDRHRRRSRQPPFGSSWLPSPARIEVRGVIVGSPFSRTGRCSCHRPPGPRCGWSSPSFGQGGGGSPCGSRPLPSPARIEVWVVISVAPSA